MAAYRTGITTADVDATAVPMIPTKGASLISFGGVCSTAGGSITFRVLMLNLAGNIVGSSQQITMTCHPLQDWPAATGGVATFSGIPSLPMAPLPICCDQVLLKVDAVSGTGAWAFYAELAINPTPVTVVAPAIV